MNVSIMNVPRRFAIPCEVNGQPSITPVLIGSPQAGHSLIQAQVDWLAKTRGVNIPGPFLDTLGRIQSLAAQHNIPPADLIVYALGCAEYEKSQKAGEDVEK